MPGYRYDASSQVQPTQFEEDSMGGVEFENPAERAQRQAILQSLMGGGGGEGDSQATDSSVQILSMRSGGRGKARGRGREEETQEEEESQESSVRRSARKRR